MHSPWTPRDRALSALRHQLPDLIPAYVRNVTQWERHADYFGVSTLDDLKERLGNTILSFIPAHLDPYIPPTPHSVTLPPIWGVPVDSAGTYSDTIPRPLAGATTVADVESYSWPSSSTDAWDFESMRESLLADGTHARMGPGWTPLFSGLCELFGMEQAMVNLRWNQPVFEAALSHLDEFYTGFFRNMLDRCGDQMEIFGIGDDFAGNAGLLFNPTLWRSHFKPIYAKWLALAKGSGLATLMHSCGLVTEVLPDLIEIGLDAWQTVQTHLPGQEPERIKAEFGRDLVFVGAIDTTNVLSVSSPEGVRDHVLSQIRILGEGGGYICAPDHTIMEDVPSENVAALYRTIAEFKEPGYVTI